MGNAGQSLQKTDIAPDAVKSADGKILGNPEACLQKGMHTIVRHFIIEADERGIVEGCQEAENLPFVKRLTADGALNDPDAFLTRADQVIDGAQKSHLPERLRSIILRSGQIQILLVTQLRQCLSGQIAASFIVNPDTVDIVLLNGTVNNHNRDMVCLKELNSRRVPVSCPDTILRKQKNA